MITLFMLMALSGYSCERKPGKAQCPTQERVVCKASCYLRRGPDGKDKEDGGYYGYPILAEGRDMDACVAELDRQAANGCQP